MQVLDSCYQSGIIFYLSWTLQSSYPVSPSWLIRVRDRIVLHCRMTYFSFMVLTELHYGLVSSLLIGIFPSESCGHHTPRWPFWILRGLEYPDKHITPLRSRLFIFLTLIFRTLGVTKPHQSLPKDLWESFFMQAVGSYPSRFFGHLAKATTAGSVWEKLPKKFLISDKQIWKAKA